MAPGIEIHPEPIVGELEQYLERLPRPPPDDHMCCSELVWKMYKCVLGLKVGRLQKMKDFDLFHPVVGEKVQDRLGEHIRLDETVISSEVMFCFNQLVTVYKE